MLRQRVYGIAAGYEDLNDHNELKHDKLYQSIAGRDKALSGASTLSRFENNSTREMCLAISIFLIESFIKSHRIPPKEIIQISILG